MGRVILLHDFNDLMEKDPSTKFCGVLISSHEVIKLKSFESGVNNIIPENVQKTSCLLFVAHIC